MCEQQKIIQVVVIKSSLSILFYFSEEQRPPPPPSFTGQWFFNLLIYSKYFIIVHGLNVVSLERKTEIKSRAETFSANIMHIVLMSRVPACPMMKRRSCWAHCLKCNLQTIDRYASGSHIITLKAMHSVCCLKHASAYGIPYIKTNKPSNRRRYIDINLENTIKLISSSHSSFF